MVRTFDLNQHLGTLQSLLDAHAGDRAEVAITVSAEKSPVKLDASALDAALVELVANGRTALTTAGRVIVRTKCIGRRLWLTVADTGKGMSREELAAVLEGASSSRCTRYGSRPRSPFRAVLSLQVPASQCCRSRHRCRSHDTARPQRRLHPSGGIAAAGRNVGTG
ncbi:ATP-binding protein [Sphingobium xenophagum]